MSAHILVLGDGRLRKICRRTARRKVERGQFRWKDHFTIEAIPQAAMKRTLPVWHDPKATFVWQPRPSAHFIVMQARWGKTA